jgi:cytochrome oxidase Cu insertion factor (SCO1/SenC/PrrC family)
MQRFPTFELEDADGKVVTDGDLLGHPAVVYLARHPG